MNLETVYTLVETGLAVVGGSAILAAWLPRPVPGSRLGFVFLLLDLAAQNYLRARNAGGG